MLENRRRLLPVRLTHGPTLLGILTATLVTLLIQSLPLNAQESQYSGQGSYAIYPGWTGPEMQEGLLQVTFRTRVGEGLLLYAEGTASVWAEALAVMLEGGRIVVRVQRQEVVIFNGWPFPSESTETEELFVSENLNDNMTHTLSLQQTPDNFTVSVLDRSASVVSPLLSRSSNIGSVKIYIGGLPINQSDAHIQFSISDSFSGCLVDVQSSNGSTNASSLVSVSPIERQGVVDGCSEFDPCVGVSCGGGGRCVALSPDSYFCDCSSTRFGGTNCSEDIDECGMNNSVCASYGPNALCINTNGSYECTCEEGYRNNDTFCENVDECAEGTHNCSSNAKCTDIYGGYYCNCTEGFIRHGNGQLCEGVITETTVPFPTVLNVTDTNDSAPLPVDFIAALTSVLLSLILIV